MINKSSNLHIYRILPALLVGWLLFASDLQAKDEPREIIVGTWDNRPIVFRDTSGEIAGVGVDILKEVAKEKHWKLTFKHGSWAEKYDELQNGQIDLLVGIAYTQKRDELFDYPE
jgi:ABC-type amino acid transport substrate-binding protein